MLIQLIYFGGGLASLLALSQMLRKFKLENILLAILLLSIGFLLIFLGLLLGGDLVDHPWVNVFANFFACAFGPLFYIYFRYISDDAYQIKPKLLVHLLPGLVAFTILFWYGYTEKLFESSTLQQIVETGELGAMGHILIGEVSYVAYYLILFSRHLPAIWFPANATERKKLKHILFITMLGTAAAAVILFYSWTSINIIGRVGGAGIAGILMYIFILSQRYPDLILFLVEEEKKRRYSRSQLSNIDIKQLESSLATLMEENKVYCEEELSLKELASRVTVTPHQLSEFLNNQLNTSFKSFVNRYRVDEAKRLLLADTQRSTISIAYEVGFNSSSAFHNAFRKETNQSPGQYRKGASRYN